MLASLGHLPGHALGEYSMKSLSHKAISVIASLTLCLAAGAAQAQANRTFVSTGGSDGNTASHCGSAAPCRTFGAAISVTNAGGEIVPLTSGGYGPVSIDKSIQVSTPPGVYA